MKRSAPLISLLIALFLTTTAHTQSCLPSGIVLGRQSDIDNFYVNFPQCTAIEGRLYIWETDGGGITNLEGLEQIESVGGDLRIIATDALPNLEGLERLQFVGGDLRIFRNESLLDLSGLEGLQSIGGNLIIQENTEFRDLSVLDGVSNFAGEVEIWGNPQLAVCQEALVCDYLTGLDNIYTARVFSNATGCMDPREILEACNVSSTQNVWSTTSLQVYPNPTQHRVQLRGLGPVTATVAVFDGAGQRLFETAYQPDLEVDLSAYPSGLYWLAVSTERGQWVERVVKR